MQRAKFSRFAPRGRLAPLEETLSQFNRWLAIRYRQQAARMGYMPKSEAAERRAAI